MHDENTEYKPKPFGPPINDTVGPGDTLKSIMGATKYDQGKPRIALVLGGFAKALRFVAQVGTFGANKYSPNGWKSVPNGEERYMDALGRHLLADAEGEELDPESGLPHLAHAAWNILAVMEYRYGQIKDNETDNSTS